MRHHTALANEVVFGHPMLASTYSTQPPFSTPFGPQLSYPYRPQSSGFQRCKSQAFMGHYPEAPVFDYQTHSPQLFSPQLHKPQANLVVSQYYDPGSSGAYSYHSSTGANPFSSPGMFPGTENYDADLFSRLGDCTPSLRYPFPDRNVDAWLKNDVDGHEKEVLPWDPSTRQSNQATYFTPRNFGSWSYDSEAHGEQSSYTTTYQHAPYIHPSELQESYGNELQGGLPFDDSHVADQKETHGDSAGLDLPSPVVEFRSDGKKINAPSQTLCRVSCNVDQYMKSPSAARAASVWKRAHSRAHGDVNRSGNSSDVLPLREHGIKDSVDVSNEQSKEYLRYITKVTKKLNKTMSDKNDEQARQAHAAQNAQPASNSSQPQNLTPQQAEQERVRAELRVGYISPEVTWQRGQMNAGLPYQYTVAGGSSSQPAQQLGQASGARTANISNFPTGQTGGTSLGDARLQWAGDIMRGGCAPLKLSPAPAGLRPGALPAHIMKPVPKPDDANPPEDQ
ncbi:hypothetical protein FOXB_10191 [Fusarium oxysporum f. sp. conglutinans Fo5176]|uniref:Uncharacterized protein n=3 Tax=Fusarium oxysporum f. sp. conglutinans TaxID=100902 RepID=F9FUW0_FUSOF|nr:hypothetical protein FOXB_10191 [Fusarium oxysporum f. sp. conglutinans Fo5176]